MEYLRQRYYTGTYLWVDLVGRQSVGEHARRGETRRFVIILHGKALTSFPDGLAGRKDSLTLAKRLDEILEL